jgi:hypothetical protein
MGHGRGSSDREEDKELGAWNMEQTISDFRFPIADVEMFYGFYDFYGFYGFYGLKD